MLDLPWPASAHVLRDVVEPTVPADDEDVVVGDGTEGLVTVRAIRLHCSRAPEL
jgi:hypothetical protein